MYFLINIENVATFLLLECKLLILIEISLFYLSVTDLHLVLTRRYLVSYWALVLAWKNRIDGWRLSIFPKDNTYLEIHTPFYYSYDFRGYLNTKQTFYNPPYPNPIIRNDFC